MCLLRCSPQASYMKLFCDIASIPYIERIQWQHQMFVHDPRDILLSIMQSNPCFMLAEKYIIWPPAKSVNCRYVYNFDGLTYCVRYKVAVILQTTFSNAFSWVKMMYEFWLKFHWSLFPMAQSTKVQHWLRKWLGTGQVIIHSLNYWDLLYYTN